MPPKPEPGTAADWLRHARSDLALARGVRDEEVLLEALCFHAQQAAEKSLKGVLAHRGVEDIPFTHDIARLITEIKGLGLAWPSELDDADELSAYATGARYPGDLEEVTEEEHRRSLDLAGAVLKWAEEQIEG